MPKMPGSRPDGMKCDPRLPVEALAFRIPCKVMCAPMRRHYFPGVPWFYSTIEIRGAATKEN
jgi:hypothetical protein